MPFEIESTTLIYVCAALSAVLFVEAIYLLGFSTASYRGRVNRRLRLMQDQSDSQAVLLQLRRERGLTSSGLYGLPTISLNRLILQSGLTVTPWRGVLIVGGTAVAVFLGILWVREDLLQAAIAAPGAGLVLPYLSLHVLRRRRQRHFAEQFADAIDIIVRSLRAGHPVPVAIGMVAREMGDPVGTEFGIVADEITYGADLETAMRNLSFRVGQEDLPLFVTAVAIQGSTGGGPAAVRHRGRHPGLDRRQFKRNPQQPVRHHPSTLQDATQNPGAGVGGAVFRVFSHRPAVGHFRPARGRVPGFLWLDLGSGRNQDRAWLCGRLDAVRQFRHVPNGQL
jgi:tight adherence protein B